MKKLKIYSNKSFAIRDTIPQQNLIPKSNSFLMKYILLFIILVISFSNVYGQSITWQRTYNGPFNFYDYGEDACKADSGNFYIVGHLFDSQVNRKIYVLKINAYGDTLWTKVIGTGNLQQAFCVERTPDGGCVFSGYWDSAYTMKLLPNGNIGWLKFYNNIRSYRCVDIIKSNTNGYLLCGFDDYYTSTLINLDSLGNLIWSKSYNNILFEKMCNGHDSGYVICANQIFSGSIIKVNDTGNIVWSKSFGFTPKLVSRISNGYVLSGAMSDSTLLSSFGFYRVDINGNILTKKIFSQVNISEYVESMLILNDNRYVFGVLRDSGVISFFKPIICDSNGTIIKTNYYPVNEAHTFSLTLANNGDLLFAGWYVQPINGDRDVYAIRTDSNLNAPLIGIKNENNIYSEKNEIINCFPNPFNNNTKIKFNVKKNSLINIDLFDILGRKINIYNNYLYAGTYEFNFIKNELSSGFYILTLSVNGIIEDKIKLIILK